MLRFFIIFDIANLTEQQLIKDMMGRDFSAFYKREDAKIGEVIFEAINMSGNNKNIVGCNSPQYVFYYRG